MTYGGPVYQNPDYPQKIEVVATRWVVPGWSSIEEWTFTPNAGKIYFVPIFVSKLTLYDRIGVEVINTPGASTLDLRVFEWDSGVPGIELLDAGSVDTATPGVKSIVIALTLARGYYFLAGRTDSAVTQLNALGQNHILSCPVTGYGDSPATSLFRVIPTITAAWSDPATAPTSAESLSDCFIQLREG